MAHPALHVTAGDAAAEALRRMAAGPSVAWGDLLAEGPVRRGHNPITCASVRASFHECEGWGTFARALVRFEARDHAVAHYCGGELVLWFGPGPAEQLSLLQLLSRLAPGAPAVDAVSLALLPAVPPDATPDAPFEAVPKAALGHAYRARVPVEPGGLAHARRLWDAFADDDPLALQDALAAPLPFYLNPLADALYRMLEAFPRADNGLCRLEAAVVRAAAGGARAVDALYARAHLEAEPTPFLPRRAFRTRLRWMAEAEVPLLASDGPDTVFLTAAGEAVAAGRADWGALGAAERWVGGAYLESRPAWRWDPAAGRLVRDRAAPAA